MIRLYVRAGQLQQARPENAEARGQIAFDIKVRPNQSGPFALLLSNSRISFCFERKRSPREQRVGQPFPRSADRVLAVGMEGVRFRSWKRFDDRVSVTEQPSLHLLYCEPKENPRPRVAPFLDLQQFLLEANAVPVIEIDNHNDCGVRARKALSVPSEYLRQLIQNNAFSRDRSCPGRSLGTLPIPL